MIESILVATDASPASNRAIDLAANMAARYGASLEILHVVRDMQLPEELRKMAEVEKLAAPRRDVLEYVGKKILGDATARAREHGAEKVATSLAHGDPANAILNAAREKGSDLVVLGTRGLGQVKGMLMGSVSRKVTNLAEVNCLVVR